MPVGLSMIQSRSAERVALCAIRHAANKVNLNCHGRLTTDNGRCGLLAIPKHPEFSKYDALSELLSTTV